MMPEQNQDNNPKTTNRKKKRLWLAVIVVVLAAIIGYLLVTYESAENQLAAIDAARAIPDSENAAIIYNELLAKDEKIPSWTDFLGEDAKGITLSLPWTSEDYPEIAKWIKGHQPTIDRLLHASSFDKCRFPIADYINQQDFRIPKHSSTIFGWVYLLARAANNDIAEGRTDDAIAKYRCVTQLAKHLYQQPVFIEHLVGTAVETLGLQGLYRLLIETDLTETQIEAIEQFQPNTRDNWADVSAEILEVERLLSKKMGQPLARLKAWWSGMSGKSSLPKMQDVYLRIVSDRRALKIIIELRRYKNKHSHWPKTLDEIKTLAPAEVFVDLVSGDSFVYKLADDTFILYSKGKNNIDEHGQRNSTIDPNTRELIVHKDDRLIWPRKIPKKKKENTDDK